MLEKRKVALKNQLKKAGFLCKPYKLVKGDVTIDKGERFSFVQNEKSVTIDFIEVDNGNDFPGIWISINSKNSGVKGFYDYPEQVELVLQENGFILPLKNLEFKFLGIKRKTNEAVYPN